jgi:hypothetical protein
VTLASRQALRPLDWIGPLIGALGIAAVVLMLLRTTSSRTLFEGGVLSIALTVDRALPLAGLGLALAIAQGREAALGILLLGLGLVLGFVGREWLLSLILTGPKTIYRLRLIGPLACLVVGVTLVSPERTRRWLRALAAVGLGALLALAIKLDDPSFHDPNFPRGAIAATIWLASAVGLTGRSFAQPWLGTAVRIFGSWLIAIGLLLGGAALAPRAGPGKPSVSGQSSRATTGAHCMRFEATCFRAAAGMVPSSLASET